MKPARSRPRLARLAAFVAVCAAVALLAAACGSDSGSAGSPGTTEAHADTVRLVTHDSFNVSDQVLADFEAQTGIHVEVVKGGDAVEVVNQAILTKDHPQGDVLFGIDNNLLTRALDEGLFQPYQSPGLANVDAAYVLDPQHRVTPIDHGDVCINVDRAYYAKNGQAAPQTLQDLADPAYKGQLVVENPSTSTPGLAFLLATRAAFGDGWLDYWKSLKDNDVLVSDGWEQAYYGQFSGGSGQGNRPLVVSYASSPPAEVTDPASTPADQSPTYALADTCYRQIEFAGLLSGADHPEAGRMLIDFLLSVPFQEDMPLQMYVYPVNNQANLPEAFVKYTVPVDQPLLVPSDEVNANRDQWIQQWTSLFGG